MNKTEKIVKVINILKKEKSFTMLGDMGKKYNAYKILIATILSARSKDEVTYPIAEQLFKKYPTAIKLANAKKTDVIKIIRKIGFYNQKADYIINSAKKIINEFKGKVPASMEKLNEFPGVGNKVAGCVMVYAFGKKEIPVDVHVAVISNRLGLTKNTNPDKIMVDLKEIAPKRIWMDINDLLVWHGKEVCDTRKPKCYKCQLIKYCKYPKKSFEK